MITREEIERGNIVEVNFNNAQYTLCSAAEVLHVPCATGDSWHFRDIKTNTIHYVSEGCTVTFMQSNNPVDSDELPF